MVDIILGEPPESIHPTVWMGKISERLSLLIKVGSPVKEQVYGIFLALFVISIFTVAFLAIIEFLRFNFGILGYIIGSALIFKTTFAIRSMRNHVLPIIHSLDERSMEKARISLRKVVRRDVNVLDEQLVISASVETIAEGLVDGLVSPLFYFGVFGVPGAVAYRAINTLDSTVGYRERKYEYIGKFSAKLDTIANFIPARLTAFLIIISAFILREDWHNALTILRRDHAKTQSVNAGWPISAVAGALDVQLEKPCHYVLGDSNMQMTPMHIARALRLMYVTTALFIVLTVFPLMASVALFNQAVMEKL